jgi:hypothetical protein
LHEFVGLPGQRRRELDLRHTVGAMTSGASFGERPAGRYISGQRLPGNCDEKRAAKRTPNNATCCHAGYQNDRPKPEVPAWAEVSNAILVLRSKRDRAISYFA